MKILFERILITYISLKLKCHGVKCGNAYTVPSSLLTIMEFGGPRQEESQTTTFTFDDRTSHLYFQIV